MEATEATEATVVPGVSAALYCALSNFATLSWILTHRMGVCVCICMCSPVTLSVSSDGLKWDQTGVAITCTDLSTTSTCKLRYPGHAKNGGPSYPQALTVTDPAPQALHGVYVASSNNKEDIWVVKVLPPPFHRDTN